jgi:hypothetical protein
MKMLKVALVLLVLASFVMATTAVSMAAMATPTMKPMATAMAKPTMKATMPNATMKMPTMPAAKMPAAPKVPTRKPGMMIDLSQMQSNIGNVYKMLKDTVKMPGSSVYGPGAGVKGKASMMISDTYGLLAQGKGKSLALGVSAPQPINQLGMLPQLANTQAKIGAVPGENLMVSLGL